jgi:hypothetical protein
MNRKMLLLLGYLSSIGHISWGPFHAEYWAITALAEHRRLRNVCFRRRTFSKIARIAFLLSNDGSNALQIDEHGCALISGTLGRNQTVMTIKLGS